MILTNKSREDFLNWLKQNTDIRIIKFFKEFDRIMLNSLVLEWLDSVGIYINIRYNEVAKEFSYSLHFNPRQNDNHSKAIYKTRQEATKQAIIKANEIYNEKHK